MVSPSRVVSVRKRVTVSASIVLVVDGIRLLARGLLNDETAF